MITELDVTLCGTGTSSGIPIIGCDCPVCQSEDLRDRRTRCGAAIRFRDASGDPRMILLDCPPDHREHALRLGLNRCDAIFFTHSHVDHTFGLDDVRRYNAVQKTSIEALADQPTLNAIERQFQHIFRPFENINPSFVASLSVTEIRPLEPVDRFGVRFEPIKLLHGRMPILGFRIEALDEEGRIAVDQPSPFPLAYCTDTSSIPPETWPRLRGLRTLVLDMLRPRAHPTHLTVDQAIETAERIGADSTWFIHMSHEIRHAEVAPGLPNRMNLAWDGVRVR